MVKRGPARKNAPERGIPSSRRPLDQA